MLSSIGFSIKIFLPEGIPAGLRFVEKTNWTGQGFVCPRPRFTEVRHRTEFDKAGVYVLLRPSEAGELPMVYIGEGDPVRDRIQQHHAERDFWTIAFGFISKDTNLNKAHIQYLEHRLIALATQAKRCVLTNLCTPTEPSLSEADKHEVEGFLREMLLCFPLLGVSVFELPEEGAARQIYILERKGVLAEGYESADGFVVLKGATAVANAERSMRDSAAQLRVDLLARNIFRRGEDGILELIQDYEFSSPSTAAGAILGASVNGRDAWKTRDGRTLKELQQQS